MTFTKGISGAITPTFSTAMLDVGTAKAAISFLNQDTDTELLANPRVVTTDNAKAKINIVQKFPIPQFSFNEQTASFTINGFQYQDIGITLGVTRINKNEFVTLDIAPEVSSSSGVQTFTSQASSFSIPIIDTRMASTTVLIKSGHTLAIGGLVRQDVSDTYTKVRSWATSRVSDRCSAARASTKSNATC